MIGRSVASNGSPRCGLGAGKFMDTEFQTFEAFGRFCGVFAALFRRYVVTPAAIQVCCLFAVQCEAKVSVAFVADAGGTAGIQVSDVGQTFIDFGKKHNSGFAPVVGQVAPSLAVKQVDSDASVGNSNKQSDARAGNSYLFWCAHIFVWLVAIQTVFQSLVVWWLMFGNSQQANGGGNRVAAKNLRFQKTRYRRLRFTALYAKTSSSRRCRSSTSRTTFAYSSVSCSWLFVARHCKRFPAILRSWSTSSVGDNKLTRANRSIASTLTAASSSHHPSVLFTARSRRLCAAMRLLNSNSRESIIS